MPAPHAQRDEGWRERRLVALQKGADHRLVCGGLSHARDIAPNGYGIKPAGWRNATASAILSITKGSKMRLIVLAALALAACQPVAPQTTAPAAPAAESPAPPALKPSGPPRTVAAEGEPMEAAYVTDVRMVEGADGAKFFSTAGGDPAINGLYTYLALFTAPEGWTRVFQIGDFNSWEVVEESAERVTLRVSRSWIEEGSGDIKTAEEYLFVTLPDEQARTVEVTPAS